MKDAKAEVKNLASRHPPKGTPATVPASVRAAIAEIEANRAKDKMGAAYDKAMPSPERYAGGGAVKGWGKARGGKGCKMG